MMCAIAGMIGCTAEKTVQNRMLKTMIRRGPDATGAFTDRQCCLLHARLSIIDPTGGGQPMQLEWAGEEFTIVYNGELYNTEEIRTQLCKYGHTFLTRSDTEVILHAFAHWGSDALEHMNGIFAFAIWQKHAQKLFLARDRIGVKPLFYMPRTEGLLFASEIKTILAHPQAEAKLDAQGIAEILMIGPGRTPGCGVLCDVNELEPGCFAEFANRQLSITRYWQLKDREHNETFEQTADHVRSLVLDAIERQMVSDVPIGTFLSGGLDSSIISAVCSSKMQEKGDILNTFSVDYLDNEKFFQPGKFQPNADAVYIDIMCNAIRSNHHWTVLSPEQLLDALEDATSARDLPGMADVDFSLLLFCKDIRNHVKVTLSGECADEIFGGYPWYRDPEIRDADGFPWAQTTMQRMSLLHPQLRDKISGEEYVQSRYQRTLDACDILPTTNPLEKRMKQMVNLNFRWFMQTLLDRKDRMSMYSGLEVRVPFCDYRIAEYMYGVPWEYKDYNGVEKGLLRYAMRGLLPNEVLYRKKSPYPKTHHPLYLQLVTERMKRLLQDGNAPLFELVDREALLRLMKTDFTWPWYGQLMRRPQTIAYLLQINSWLQQFSVRIV